MDNKPIFLGVYAKSTYAGNEKVPETRWHVWKNSDGTFTVQLLLPDNTISGEKLLIDSQEFFNEYRVHSAFSTTQKNNSSSNPTASYATSEKIFASVPVDVLDENFDDGLDDDIAYRQASFNIDSESSPAQEESLPLNRTFAFPEYDSSLEDSLRTDFSMALIRLNNDQKNAVETFTKIIDNPGPFTAIHKFMFSDFGTALRRRKLYMLACQCHEKAHVLAPDDEHILFNLARAFYDAGQLREARRCLIKSVDMVPSFKIGHIFLDFIEKNTLSQSANVMV